MNPAKQAASTGTPDPSHALLAMEQRAMHTVRLAVTRWRIGYTSQDAAPTSIQARWLARTQSQFSAWLEAGGFAQQDSDASFLETDGSPGHAHYTSIHDSAAAPVAAAICQPGSVCAA